MAGTTRQQNIDGTLIPTANMTKIKQNVISGLNYFTQNCPIRLFRFAIQTFLKGRVEKNICQKKTVTYYTDDTYL